MKPFVAHSLLATLSLISVTAFAAAATAPAAPVAATPAAAAPVAAPQVRLTCGGIGSDESSAMLADSGNHALTLIFVSADGHYTSDVQTRIETIKGALVAENSCGPIGQLDVTTMGSYKIKVTAEGVTQEKTVSLAPKGGKRIYLRWKAD
jgi:hypothetical protein